MHTYTFLRQLADSWVLLAMFSFFASAAVWAFLPSLRGAREDASLIPFRDDTPDCSGTCETCNCKDAAQLPEATPNE